VLLQGCLDDLGSEVLRRPESYFWFNKRWVLQPKEDA
jgi:lauroyl/myristoyl acyltransferase